MSGPFRLPHGGEIDRGRPLAFTFDGRKLSGFEGDTIASALLASGVRVVGRSFKYHRPRGIFAAGVEEPNAIVDLWHGQRHDPNARATIEPLADAMEIRSIHARGTAAKDAHSYLDGLARFIPAGFYYKTFMRPSWHLYEGRIRAMAGLGRLDPTVEPVAATHRHATVDTLVVGGGPAGVAEAGEAARAGRNVLLVEQDARLGGRMPEGVTVLLRATAFALYDHLTAGIVERGLPGGERLWRVRAREIVLATGAIERPLLFAGNDKPGVMLAGAVLAYLRRYAVLAGSRVVVASNNAGTVELVSALRSAGADVREVGTHIAEAMGDSFVRRVRLTSGEVIEADCVAVSGGFQPTLHLYAHAKGRPRWDAERGMLVPGEPVPGIRVVGSAAGAEGAIHVPTGERASKGAFAKGRVFVDLQNDVTTKDIALAVSEAFSSVEHLKRYTTLGMATDQGKTSSVNGLEVLSGLTGREIGALGTTTYRPPFAPVAFATIAGRERGRLHTPIRRLPAEDVHRADGAYFRDYGILRPAWYTSIEEECLAARNSVAVFDGSPLGKIEVIGPDAARLMDFVFYTPMSTLAPGRLRYGFMLTESGAVLDDGVVLRLAEDRFVVSCSSSHVPAIAAHLEAWRQDQHDIRKVFIHDTTPSWGTVTIAGPHSKAAVERLGLGVALDDASLPHMAMREGRFGGAPARVARVSFIGERSYEISVPATRTAALWRAARSLGAVPFGVEALMVLRTEKGFIIVGVDTDGETMPHDIGAGGPRERRTDPYVGDRSLFLPAAMDAKRRQLVGIASEGERIPTGAHAIEGSGMATRSIGFVTSSHESPALGRPVALGLIEQGRARMGDALKLQHLGRRFGGRIVPPCFLDAQGARLHA
jgi:sarcosine oxidase subunit alpha